MTVSYSPSRLSTVLLLAFLTFSFSLDFNSVLFLAIHVKLLIFTSYTLWCLHVHPGRFKNVRLGSLKSTAFLVYASTSFWCRRSGSHSMNTSSQLLDFMVYEPERRVRKGFRRSIYWVGREVLSRLIFYFYFLWVHSTIYSISVYNWKLGIAFFEFFKIYLSQQLQHFYKISMFWRKSNKLNFVLKQTTDSSQ